MSRVLTFSRVFPSYHPKAGQLTYFPEKIWKSLYDMNIFYGIGEHENRYNEVFPIRHDPLENIHNHLPKYHTIRAGKRWKAGDYFSPAVWGNDINSKSGRSGPYHSKQIKFAPDIEIKKVWDIQIKGCSIYINEKYNPIDLILAKNDGLTFEDLADWFKMPCNFQGQIICWNENINY